MNKFVICAMDKRKTKEELLDNFNDSHDNYEAKGTVCSATVLYVSNAAYFDYCLEDILNEYFEITGENREAYQKEANK